jgi:hypothetical protein
MNGLPPHIAQVVACHDSLASTMGYAAIYPAEAIEAHRAFIARRCQVRPAEEYRTVTSEEWDEFLGHFERRKLALGECGRAYGTECSHEHACVRCPVLITSPTERPRLIESGTTCETASPKQSVKDGWEKQKDYGSASPPPTKRSPNWTPGKNGRNLQYSLESPRSIR